ncbi:hypothetical protein QJS10_CPB17g01932 [Acorus calamus]|uniref:Serine aminopeptidase S33 domain-containing protein n=1 Tax=Acorus calamus TaxID=4465 RepID=A0AAV9CTH4_ACOCL|nr:hypothetical protein QJS10_CPB17g01932 [Acorus calamus]
MDQLVNFIIRPPRADYNPKDDLLDQEFILKGRWFQRKDLEVVNSRGNKLQCSHYTPLHMPEENKLPCVIYCHGNSGCRTDASEAAIILLPSNITVFTLDFSGSGLSEGEHVTLGWNEKDDLKAVVNHLREDGHVSCIGLWGRSMGAVTSLMYGAEDPSIAGMVLDSPFSNLVDLMMELVDTYKYPLPKFTVRLAIQHMRKVIKKKANFDIMDLNAIQVAKCCFVPVLLGHANDDDFIHPHHSDLIYDSYVGDKNIIKFDGDHNSPRPQFYFDSITIFFHNVLNPPKDVLDENYLRSMHDYFDKDGWSTIHEQEYKNHNFSGSPKDIPPRTTEDAINQLRSRRPMSRTEVPPDFPAHDKVSIAEDNRKDNKLTPSSSSLISYEFSNGSSCAQLIPTAMDDNYVEYSFDDFSDIPCNIEDEERMFMEAVMQSLKDLEINHPHEEGQPPGVNTVSTNKPEDSSKASTSDHCANSKLGSETAGSLPSPSNTHKLIDRDIHPDEPVTSITGSAGVSNTTKVDALSSVQSSSEGEISTQDSDMASRTRATLVVQKTPTGHIMDGLAHRWGLNFFRNTQGKQ